MSNVLDDLFQWASQQDSVANQVSVQIAIATNETTRDNLVSYAQGQLNYFPPTSHGPILLGAYFESNVDAVTQYFSDRRYGPNTHCPFDCNQTDPLQVRINGSFLGGNYSITLKSLKWNFEFTFEPSFDAATGILLMLTDFVVRVCALPLRPL